MKKILKQGLSLIISFAMFITLLPCTSFAAENIQTVYMDVTYGQTEARSMLDMINEFRTGNEAWVWNESNDKQIYSELNNLNYDYDLERIAMQRAAEIALSYSHTRPDGSRCFTAYDTYYSCGENIAAGYTSAEAVFEAWKETNEKYEGQGHRRNMLNAGYTAVGISHVIYNGVHYWVQEFRNPLVNKEETEPLDSTATVSIDMLLSDANVSLNSDTESMTVSNGQPVKLPEVTTTVQMTNTWPRNSARIVTCDYNWSVEDEQYATISGDYVTGIKAGSTTLNAVILGQKISIPIIIKEPEHTHHYSEPEFNWSADYSSATAVFVCGCSNEETVDCTVTSQEADPSCTVAGVITYTATAEFNGETYTDTKTDEGSPATGHTFKYTDNGDGTHTKTCSGLTTYTLTLPEGLIFSEEFIDSDDKGSYIKLNSNSFMVNEIQSVVALDNKTISITVNSTLDLPNDRYEDLEDYYDYYDYSVVLTTRLDFQDGMIVVDSPLQENTTYTLDFSANAQLHYKFNDTIKYTDASTSDDISTGEGELTLNKKFDNRISVFGDYSPIVITINNPSLFTMPVGDIQEILPVIWYIKPADIESMFHEADAESLTLTITNATLCEDDPPMTVTGTDGNSYETNIDNTWSGSKYDGLGDVDGSSYTNDYATSNGATITFQLNNDVLEAEIDSQVYKIGESQEYETVDDFYDAIHFKVTYYTQYSVYWDNSSRDISLSGGSNKSFEILSTFKDTFMLLTKDSINRYDNEYNFSYNGIPSITDIVNANQSVLYYPDSCTIYKTASDTISNRKIMEFNLDKARTIDGNSVEDGDEINAGDIVEYNIDISKNIQIDGEGNVTNYDIVPLVEQISGDQVLLVSVQENVDKASGSSSRMQRGH